MTNTLASFLATGSRMFPVAQRIHRWFDRRARNAAFAELDDARLRDIGLSPDDITRVRARVFW